MTTLATNVTLDQNARWSAYVLPDREGEEIRSAAGNPAMSVHVVRKDFEDPAAFVYAYDMLLEGYKADPAESCGRHGADFMYLSLYTEVFYHRYDAGSRQGVGLPARSSKLSFCI